MTVSFADSPVRGSFMDSIYGPEDDDDEVKAASSSQVYAWGCKLERHLDVYNRRLSAQTRAINRLARAIEGRPPVKGKKP